MKRYQLSEYIVHIHKHMIGVAVGQKVSQPGGILGMSKVSQLNQNDQPGGRFMIVASELPS